jgi:dihydrofolate synthase/folylpolyglutamate synthase
VNLTELLERKPLAYKEIDYDRMPNAYRSVEKLLPDLKYIHIVGTNGKGTTGRYLAEMLLQSGFRVGHYTSPHIDRVNERFWLNGELVSDGSMETAHSELQKVLPHQYIESLSYFEYLTLLMPFLFQDTDFVVLEAGLGGEYDATAVFQKELSIFTAIGYDHQDYLGNSLEEIGATKFRSMKNSKKALLSSQIYSEVYEIFDEVVEQFPTVESRVLKLNEADFLRNNFSTALSALEELQIENSFKFQDFKPLEGRVQKIAHNIVCDVGHNSLAIKSVLGVIDTLLKSPVTLIYNSLSDKPYREILEIAKEKIDRVEIIDIGNERAIERDKLTGALVKLEIPFNDFKEINSDRNYLVFGSFKVVEEFRKIYIKPQF